MAGRVVPVRFGDVELLVETVPVASSEPTSAVGMVGQRVVDVFDEADTAIVAVASSVAGTVRRLAARSACPDRVQVEFGVKFSVQGKAIVAAASGEATLRVMVSYESAGVGGKEPETGSEPD